MGEDRLDELERRIARIEAVLNLGAEPALAVETPIEDVIPFAPLQAEVHVAIPPPLPVIVEYPAAPAPVPKKKTARDGSLEQTLGLKWTGWVGALVLLIGVGLGVKFVFEQHWFATIPKGVWPVLIAIGGFALIGLGEWAYRKVDVIPAASLFGVGVATLFLASYVGYAYYRIYDPGVAFTLMAISAVVGAVVARRGNLVSIGILSVLGGQITPIVVHTDHPRLGGFLLYLAMLELVALFLAFLGSGKKWWALRMLSWVAGLLWMAAVSTSHTFADATTMKLAFCVVFALGYQVEAIASDIRGGLLKLSEISVAFSFLVTISLSIGGLWILRDLPRADRTEFVAMEMVGTCALAIALRRPRLNCASLAEGFAFQSVGLAALLIPVALTGEAILIGWGILALTMAVLGTRPGMLAAKSLAPAVWVLAVLDLVRRLALPGSDPIGDVWLHIGGTPLMAGLILGWGLALIGQAVGRLTGGRAGLVLSIAAAGVWIGISMYELPMLGATGAILALGWLMTALNAPGEALGLIAVAAVKWAILDGIAQRLSPQWSAMEHRPLVNWFVGMGVLLAASLPAVYFLRRKSILALLPKQDEGQVRFILAQCVIVILAIAFSLQIDLIVRQATVFPWPMGQLENLSLTILWSVAVLAIWASAMATTGKSEADHIRWLGVLLVLKFATVDTVLWHGEQVTAGFGFNLLTAAALVLAVLVVVMSLPRVTAGAVTLATVTLLWAAIFEIDRAINSGAIRTAWPALQLLLLLVTTLCAAAAMGLFVVVGRLREEPGIIVQYRQMLAGILAVIGIFYLTADTVLFRVIGNPVRAWLIVNPQVLAAAVTGAGLALVWTSDVKAGKLCGFLMMLVVLWTGTLEIDRFFHWIVPGTVGNPQLAANVAISIFWGVFAVLCVIFGFRFHAAPMRYFGLALFGVTLVKIVVIDLGQVGTGYRVLSFMGVGAMLLGTSVLYGKLSPRLLAGVKAGSFVNQ